MLKTKLRDSIRLRFLMIFMGTLFLAALVTFPTILLSESLRIMDLIQGELEECALRLEALADQTRLPAGRLATLAGNSDIEVQVQPQDWVLADDEGNTLTLREGDKVLFRWRLGQLPQLAMRTGGQNYLMIPSVTNNRYEDLKAVAFRVLWACMLIGSLLMLLAVKTITEPVRRLNDATKRVAQGDFSIAIPEAAKDELGQLTRNFNRMARQLGQMETLRSDFVSSISHEFKTPLASIQGFARLLQKKGLPPEQVEEYSQVILEETTRLTTLSSNILRLSALENRTLPHQAAEFSLDESIRRCVVLLAPQWEEKEIDFDLELETTPYYGDEDLLQQVWLNLIGNAVKFSDKGGKVALTLRKGHSGIHFTCRDEGPGIAPGDQARIYEKFYQADRSRRKEGNGLGLAIVKQILNLCDGDIRLDSRPGQGTTFTVTLPVRRA